MRLPTAATSIVSPDPHIRAWARLAPAGLIAVGFGASLIGEATLRKGRGEAFALYGTAALTVFNAGLCLFGEVVRHRVLADVARGEAF
ncbi:MAG TPA: hypothetical protein VGB53_08915 [Rubricoccaceae bacterium]|jgi:hypothetical protein